MHVRQFLGTLLALPVLQQREENALEVERMLQEDSDNTIVRRDDSLRDPAGSSHLMAGDLELSESSRV